MGIELHGRRKIYTAVESITADNVVEVVNHALGIHMTNVIEMDYLYWYRRGVTPVLRRKKEKRPEICNKISNNIAESVVSFKNGYFLEKNAFYVSRREDESVNDRILKLNEYLYASGKPEADNSVVNWFHTVGVGAIYVEPNKENDPEKPVNVYALDPRQGFVVYSLNPGNRPVLGISMVITEDGKTAMFDVFTESVMYRLKGSVVMPVDVDESGHSYGNAVSIVDVQPNVLGCVPIIEYTYNENRMSAFECAVPLMDAYNTVISNDVDGIEQFIQSLIIATNVEFEEGTTANTIRESGMICLKSIGENKADFKILSEQLDQEQTQITLENLYNQILERCGVPSNMREQRGTSDNVGAVYLRNGWSTADTCARCTEDLYRQSNRLFDKIFLKVLAKKGALKLGMNDFEIKVIRNDMSNLLLKTQAAMNLKSLGLSPEITFERSGLSNDPITDVEASRGYIDTVFKTVEMLKNEQEEQAKASKEGEGDATGNFVKGYYRGDRHDQ